MTMGAANIRNCLEGGHAEARHNAGGAETAAANGGFESDAATIPLRDSLDKHAGSFGSCNLADDDRVVLIDSEILGEQFENPAMVPMGDVETNDGRESTASLHASAPIRSHANREADLLAGIANGSASRSIEHMRWIIPRPPILPKAMAIVSSQTEDMLAAIMGMRNVTPATDVERSTSAREFISL